MKNYIIKGRALTKVRSNPRILKLMGISMILYRQSETFVIKSN